MTVLTGVAVLLVFQIAGDITARLFHLPVPGPVLGMAFLFAALVVRGRSAESLESASGALLSHLSLLFVPAGVGVIVHLHRIRAEWGAISMALIVSTILTMGATALTMKAVQWCLTKGADRVGR